MLCIPYKSDVAVMRLHNFTVDGYVVDLKKYGIHVSNGKIGNCRMHTPGARLSTSKLNPRRLMIRPPYLPYEDVQPDNFSPSRHYLMTSCRIVQRFLPEISRRYDSL